MQQGYVMLSTVKKKYLNYKSFCKFERQALMSVDRQEPEMQLIWAPTIIISPTQPVAIGQPRQLQVSLKLTVCFAFSGFLRILIGILHQTNFYCLNLIF